MNQIQALESKIVEFNGSELMAIKTDDGKVYGAVKWICEGIGLTEGQVKNERKRLQDDLVLSQGGRNLSLPTNGGIQEVLCIDLDFLPLWLAKISITPNMQKEAPWTVKRLVEFQLKAKDALSEAFFKKPKTQLEIMQQQIEMLVQHEREVNALKERSEAIEKRQLAVEQKQDNIVEVLSLKPLDWRKEVNSLFNKIVKNAGSQFNYQLIRNETYKELESRAKCNLNIRLNNKKKNMLESGMSQSTINKVNRMDIISEDSRLTEIYLSIIKEYAIRFNVKLQAVGE